MAFGDVLTHQFQICQFVDTPQFVNLESVLVQLSPKECLMVVSSTDTHCDVLKQLMERNGISITERKKGLISPVFDEISIHCV